MALKQINWREPKCGGIAAHGTSECEYDDQGLWVCKCVHPPKNMNYEMAMALAVEIKKQNLYLKDNSRIKDFDVFVLGLFGQFGKFKEYQLIQGTSIRQRFFSTMINDVKGRHGITSGFETHPEVSKYDGLMLKMIKEMDIEKAHALSEKMQTQQRQEACLSFSSKISPVITRAMDPAAPSEAKDDDEYAEAEEGTPQTSNPKKRDTPASREDDAFLQIMASISGDGSEKRRKLEIEEERLKLESERIAVERMKADTERQRVENESRRLRIEEQKAIDASANTAAITQLLLQLTQTNRDKDKDKGKENAEA
jgi:hypothetical protein